MARSEHEAKQQLTPSLYETTPVDRDEIEDFLTERAEQAFDLYRPRH